VNIAVVCEPAATLGLPAAAAASIDEGRLRRSRVLRISEIDHRAHTAHIPGSVVGAEQRILF
jgi:hypothetical protein